MLRLGKKWVGEGAFNWSGEREIGSGVEKGKSSRSFRLPEISRNLPGGTDIGS